MDAVMLLCDQAQEAGGKLFILGGGWSIARPPVAGAPLTMGLAIKITVPWHEANLPHSLLIRLVNEDGEPVAGPDGEPVRVEGEMEVGRPPGLKPGTPLDSPLAVNFNGLPLSPGGYRWEFLIDNESRATQSFHVIPQRELSGGPPVGGGERA